MRARSAAPREKKGAGGGDASPPRPLPHIIQTGSDVGKKSV